MEVNRIQPREVITNSLVKLKRKLRCTIATVLILGALLFAMILFNAIYIRNLDA